MFSSCKHRRDCFSPKYTPCSSSRSSSQCPRAEISKDTFPCLPVLVAAAAAGWTKRLPLACCTQPLLSEAGELNTNSSSQAGSRLLSSCSTAWALTTARMRGWQGKRTVTLPSAQGQKNWFGGNKATQDDGGECLTLHLVYLLHPLHPEVIPPQSTLLPSEKKPSKTSPLSPQCHRSGAHSKNMVAGA